MHRTNEANLSSITDNLEKLRENFGQWVNLSIESDCKVVVTSAAKVYLKRNARDNTKRTFENSQEMLPKGYIQVKKLGEIMMFDLLLGGYKGNPEVMISIWEN